jgi:hypothetical protein
MLVLVAVACLGRLAAADDQPAAGIDFFEKKIRPVLADNCFKCHSTAQKKKGGLLLDSRAAVLKGGDSGPAVVPGEPTKSLLVKAIRSADPDVKMPRGGRLTEEQIADLVAWIEMGAPWPEDKDNKAVAVKKFDLHERSKHWSLQPVRRPALPPVQDPSWCRSQIDRFVLARLDAAGLKPAPPADKRTLLRRVTYDLTGLPPTPAEIDAFLSDDSLTAFAKVVDRLLASPHYGERWGRHWLDLVRFAETQGHEFDFELPEAFRYRDYVIRALNADVPYDQFVMEHIAGDLMPAPRRHPGENFNESIMGTGFWFLGEAKHSPVDVRADQADHLDNQIDVFSKTFQGMTVACARCHDHKFDAITTRDYYALCGYLESSRYQRAFIDDPEPTRQAVAKLKALQGDVTKLLGIKEAALPAMSVDSSKSTAEHTVFADFRKDSYKDWFVSGEAFGDGPSRVGSVRINSDWREPVRTLVAPGIAHSGLVSTKLHGAMRSKTFVIDKSKIHYRVLGHLGRINLIIDGYQLIRDPIYGGLTLKIDHGDKLQWKTMNVSMWQGHRAYVEILDDGDADAYIGLEQIVFSDAEPPAVSGQGGVPGPAAKEADWPRFQEMVQQYRSLEAKLRPSRRAMAMQDGTPVNERVFIRGSHKNLGEAVPPRFFEVFTLFNPGRTDDAVPARLTLARKVAVASNPLTARVMVNRLWQHHFGEGIVRTPDDFGLLGQTPTHPELLDWLAAEFVEHGWSLKKMHRLMLLSSTYQMSSQSTAEADARDADNKLLHRMPLRRLEAECIRDAMLAVSGRLEDRMYGPGVMPHLTPFMAGRGRPNVSGPLDGDGRRSIYINVRRNFLTPMLLAFDYPTPFTTIGRRGVSNVPAQALTMLNNPFVLQQAEVWARRVLKEKISSKERVQRMYETAFGRPPSAEELAGALAFVEERGAGASEDIRVWTDLCHVLFNVKEFVFLY